MPNNQSEEQGNVANSKDITQRLMESDLIAQMEARHVPVAGIDFKVYEKLVLLMIREMDKWYWRNEERTNEAKYQAFMLAQLFKTEQAAIDYLIRNKETIDNTISLPIQHACDIRLPENPNWNLSAWQRFIAKYPPNTSTDIIFRLLALADKIDAYLANHADVIERKIAQQVEAQYEKKFRQAYQDKLNQPVLSEKEWLASELLRREKVIARLTKQRLTMFVREQLGFSRQGPLSDSALTEFKSRWANLTENDREEEAELRVTVTKEMEDSLRKKYDKLVCSFFTEEAAYLSARMRETHGERLAKIKKIKLQVLHLECHPRDLMSYVEPVLYPRANENLAAASLFFSWRQNPEVFSHYLELKPVNSDLALPPILIDGAEIAEQYAGYYLRKLAKDDPRGALLGEMTSCCQSLDEAGSNAVIHGIQSEHGGFYVLCKRQEPNKVLNSDLVMAQCWAWRGKKKTIVFDSLEVQMDFANHKKTLFFDAFMYLAQELVKKHGIFRVLVGGDGGTPDEFCFFKPIKNAVAKVDLDYTDADYQYLLAHRYLPLLMFYSAKVTNSLLNIPTDMTLTPRRQRSLQRHLKVNEEWNWLLDEGIATTVSLKAIRDRVTLLEEFDRFIWHIRHGESKKIVTPLRSFFAKGINLSLLSYRSHRLIQELSYMGHLRALKMVSRQAGVAFSSAHAPTVLEGALYRDKVEIVRWVVKTYPDHLSENLLRRANQYLQKNEMDLLRVASLPAPMPISEPATVADPAPVAASGHAFSFWRRLGVMLHFRHSEERLSAPSRAR